MKRHLRNSRPNGLCNLALAAFCMLLLVGCGGAQDQLGVPAEPTAPATPTAAFSPTITEVVLVTGTHEAFETRVAQYARDRRTQVALTPRPTDLPPPLPQPTPTFELGLLDGCASANGYIPQTIGCWRGLMDGQFIGVGAGRQGRSGDPRQGLIMVFHGPLFDPMDPATEFYSTPLKLGGMIIRSVDGLRFTIGQAPGQPPGVTPAPDVTFTFDLPSRQWVTPSPGPSPSPVQSPLPSPSASP